MEGWKMSIEGKGAPSRRLAIKDDCHGMRGSPAIKDLSFVGRGVDNVYREECEE
jgi:hypothetical protein